MTKRRKFSPEFKLTQQPGISCSQIALEIGVALNLLRRWKRVCQANGRPRMLVSLSG